MGRRSIRAAVAKICMNERFYTWLAPPQLASVTLQKKTPCSYWLRAADQWRLHQVSAYMHALAYQKNVHGGDQQRLQQILACILDPVTTYTTCPCVPLILLTKHSHRPRPGQQMEQQGLRRGQRCPLRGGQHRLAADSYPAHRQPSHSDLSDAGQMEVQQTSAAPYLLWQRLVK